MNEVDVRASLSSWFETVERGTRNRARVEALIMTKGLLRPFTLAQRFVLKSREIGLSSTVTLVVGRARTSVRRGS